MPFIILSLFLILTISLAGSLLYLKEYPFSKQTLRTIKCFSCIFILYIQIKEISNSNCMLFNYVDSILGLTLLLLYKFYYQNQNLASNLFHNQRPPSEVSEQVIKINEPELELPQNLPPIMSENESRSSSKDQQEPNTTGRFQQQQEKAESSFGNKAIQRQASKENQKAVSNLSFLGDFKQSNFQKSQLGQVPFIKQSIPINQNVNLIKYSDDGEIKFGIIRTLRSINIDFVEKELDQLAKEPIISKIDQPKIQILYESSQHDVQSANNEVQSHQSRQSRQSKSSGNQQFLSGQFKEIKVEQSILQMHAKQILPKQIGWLKIIKQVIFVTIFCLSCSLFLKGDVTHLILQICNISAIFFYQVSIFQNFQILGLEVKLSFREILAWSLLIIFPVSSLYLINELQLNNLSFIAWLTIFLTSQNINHSTRNAKFFGPYIVILSLGSFLY